MNYTCLIYGGVMTFALLWYAIDARKWFVISLSGGPHRKERLLTSSALCRFKGPRINVEHVIHGDVVDDKKAIMQNEMLDEKR